jgi:hypothetical protein
MTKVICRKSRTCLQECGAKFPHDIRDCEPCPFDKHVKCIEAVIKTALVYEGEEIELTPGPHDKKAAVE